MKKFNLLLAIVILYSFSLVCAAITVTVTGTSNKNFDVSSNAVISNPSLVVSGNDNTVNVSLNGNYLGTIDSISIQSSDFDVGQTNRLTFSGAITSFTLKYDYYRDDYRCPTQDPDECPPGATYVCNPNKWGNYRCFLTSSQECNKGSGDCNNNEDCLYDKCCPEQYPINLLVTTNASCWNSAIPVAVNKNSCSGVPDNTKIEFYMNGIKLHECNVSGDSGWALIGVGNRCGVDILSSVGTGNFNLEARYRLDGTNYVETVPVENTPSNRINIAQTCGTDVILIPPTYSISLSEITAGPEVSTKQ